MKETKVALIGNPNVGKSSLFNRITGLRQKTGNYPGTTVEKRIGFFNAHQQKFKLYDFPGTYTLYPKAKDEEVVFDILCNPQHKDFPDKVIVVGSPSNLKRSLALYGQVRDLGFPVLFVLNMMDEADKTLVIKKEPLENFLQSSIVYASARTGQGVDELKKIIQEDFPKHNPQFVIPQEQKEIVAEINQTFQLGNEYEAWQFLAQPSAHFLDTESAEKLNQIKSEHKIIPGRLQVKETLRRNQQIENVVNETVIFPTEQSQSISDKLDQTFTHPIWGYVIFFLLLFFAFQAIYSWASVPMDWIDSTFASTQSTAKEWLGDGPLPNLITDGILPGIGGIVIFVPQIVILFFFLLIMEETGYMSRVVFLMDKWMKPFGLNGKSVVPLMSGAACAIPAVLSARNIENKKERLITILVTPFITCSARLPVYAILIALVIPSQKIYGIELQGLVLMGLYLLGVIAALATALILKYIIKNRYNSYLIMEMPNYRLPVWRNVLIGLWEKTSAFLFGAGKIILAVSILLWTLSSVGFSEEYQNAESQVKEMAIQNNWTEAEVVHHLESYQMEHSLLGGIGKAIEPVFRPLGYDWKISIGVLSSFAAREVFVGTMASIYSLGAETDEESTITQRMKQEKRPNGMPVYTLATGVSLLLFYAFAMQCMSTLAIVKRETHTWKWPLVQLGFMSAVAYISALLAYQLLQ